MMFLIALMFGLGVAADQGHIDLGVGVVGVVECNDVVRTCNDERDIRDRNLNKGDHFNPSEPPVGDDDDDDDDGNNGHGNDDDHDDDSNPGKGWGKGGKPGNPGKGHK